MARPTVLISLLASTFLLAAPGAAQARHGGGGDRPAVAPGAALAHHGGGGDRPEVRTNGTCGGGVRSSLELKADDGGIETEFEVHRARRGSSWRLVVVQEGRVAWRGSVRASRSRGAFTIERRLRDYSGADRISVRASGPRGVTCRASATLPGD